MQEPVQIVRDWCSLALKRLSDMVAIKTESDDDRRVLSKPEVFKKKLEIGKITDQPLQRKIADAFVRVLNSLGTGTFVAKGIIQILVALGIIASAPATGWVIVACVVAAAGHFEISRYSREGGDNNGDPLDPFAVALFYFIAPLGLRVAALDGTVTESERQCIENYFTHEWGYSRKFVHRELSNLERDVDTFPIIKVVDDLVELKKRNRGINYKAVSKELTGFLQEVARANGELHDLEVIFIQWLEIALAKGKPGFFDGLLSAVGISQSPEQPTKEKIGPSPDLHSDGDALRDGRTGNGSSGQDGQQTSTMVGRAYQSTLHWLT